MNLRQYCADPTQAAVYFQHRGICMPDVMLLVVMILALMLWRSIFAVRHWRNGLREAAGPHPHHDNALQRRFRILERACGGVIAENGFDTGSDEVCLSDEGSRAKTYLRRIVALTGARRMGSRYILHVGKTIFHARDRYVWRLPNSTNSQSGYNETCFYSAQKGMPREEEIATVLLQLKNNPALFDKWVIRNGLAFKADGQVFTGGQ